MLLFKVIKSSNKELKQQGASHQIVCPCPRLLLHASSLATCPIERVPKRLDFLGGALYMQLACHTEGHLLKSVTFHTFASAGGLPHAAPTIWIELFLKQPSVLSSNQQHNWAVRKKENKMKKQREGKMLVIALLDLETMVTDKTPYPTVLCHFFKRSPSS